MEEETAADPADTDWENRKLCRDESCIGVIGPDGRCNECGLRYDADSGAPLAATTDTALPAADEETDLPDEAPAPENPPEAITDEEWNSRQLCSDGNCIGVIGPDGKCKECGKPFLFPQDD